MGRTAYRIRKVEVWKGYRAAMIGNPFCLGGIRYEMNTYEPPPNTGAATLT